MATGPISSTPRVGGTAPLRPPGAPEVEAPAPAAPAAAAAIPAGDQVRVAAQDLKAGGTKPLAAFEPEAGEEDSSFDTALTGSNIVDTAQDLPDLIPKRAVEALEGATVTTLVADALDGEAPAPKVEVPGAVSSALTGTAGVLSAIDGANQYQDGMKQIAEAAESGDTGLLIEGSTQVAVGTTNAIGGTVAAYQGAAGLLASGAELAGAAKTAQFLAGQATKVAPLATTLGGIGSIASGAYDIAQAFDAFGNAGDMSPEEKQHKLINGSLNVIGGACMLVPGGQAVGAAILIGAAIYDNWDSITAGVEKAAEATAEFVADAAVAVKETVGAAVDTVKSWGASLARAFSFW